MTNPDTTSVLGLASFPRHARLRSFRKKFGQPALDLACHAAFPIALTPDMLLLLWGAFPSDALGQPIGAPWVAVADLLLSGLCDEVGYELFELVPEVRDELLAELKNSPRFGPRRVAELSAFVSEYVGQQLRSSDPFVRDFAEAQHWAARAATDPAGTAAELARAYAELQGTERDRLLRLEAIVAAIAQPERASELESLLPYARALADWARGDTARAAAVLNSMANATGQIQLGGLVLPLPPAITTPPSADQTIIGEATQQVDLSEVAQSNVGEVIQAPDQQEVSAPQPAPLEQRDDQQLDQLRQRREATLRRLRALELQQAYRGIDTPPEIAIEIEDLKAELVRIEAEIQALEPAGIASAVGIDAKEITHLLQLRNTKIRRLHILEEQKALAGLNVPVSAINEIASLTLDLRTIEQRLRELGAPLEPETEAVDSQAAPAESTGPLSAEDREQLEQLRAVHQKRLQFLETQAAQYGPTVPPHIVMEREDTRAKLAELDRQLAAAPQAKVPVSQAATPSASLDAEERQQLEQLRAAHQQRLRLLERQAAQYGVTTPPHVMTEIEDTRAQIAELDRRLDADSVPPAEDGQAERKALYDDLVAQGSEQYRQNDVAQAITTLTRAIDTDPTRSWAYEWRALAYGQAERYADAIQDHLRAIELHDPADEDIWKTYANLGRRYADIQDFDSAIQAFTQAIERRPADYTLYQRRAELHERAGNRANARDDYTAALALIEQQGIDDRAVVDQIEAKMAALGSPDASEQARPDAAERPQPEQTPPPEATAPPSAAQRTELEQQRVDIQRRIAVLEQQSHFEASLTSQNVEELDDLLRQLAEVERRLGQVPPENEPAQTQDDTPAQAITLHIARQRQGYSISLVGAGIVRATLALSEAQIGELAGRARQALDEVVYTQLDGQYVYQQQETSIGPVIHAQALQALARAGFLLYEQLFYGPGSGEELHALGDRLRELSQRARLRITIVAEHVFLPWALLYDRATIEPGSIDLEGFWGLRHVIECQVPSAAQGQEAPAIVPPKLDTPAIVPRDRLLLAFVGDANIDRRLQTPLVQNQRAQLEILPNVMLRDFSTIAELYNLLGASVPAELIYFFCHLRDTGSERPGADTAALSLSDGQVTLADLRTRAPSSPLPGRPLVFLNTDPARSEGLAIYFLSRGARIVIASEAGMPVFFAAEFGQEFVARFVAGEQTAGNLLLSLRRAYVHQRNNLLGLLYSLYGHADTRVEWADPARASEAA